MADPEIGTVFGKLRVVTASWREYGGRMIATLCNCAPGITRPHIAGLSGLRRGKTVQCEQCRKQAALSARRARGFARPASY